MLILPSIDRVKFDGRGASKIPTVRPNIRIPSIHRRDRIASATFSMLFRRNGAGDSDGEVLHKFSFSLNARPVGSRLTDIPMIDNHLSIQRMTAWALNAPWAAATSRRAGPTTLAKTFTVGVGRERRAGRVRWLLASGSRRSSRPRSRGCSLRST